MITREQIITFIEDFKNCLLDENWLPYISSPRYQIEVPNFRFINPANPICDFKLQWQGTLPYT